MSKNNHSVDLTERELSIYKNWEKSGAFNSSLNSSASPFTIMIPPPNVTGSLHVGHALTMTLQDTLIRWKRMASYDALWQPGTDHAGIATQMMVEKELYKKGIKRQDLGREKFLEKVWEWKETSGGNITQQLRRLGASLDWQRERFTLDKDFSAAVSHAFITLYKEGLIYRAKRLVNWDPKLQSAISDLEVKNKETQGYLWYINYPIVEIEGQFITIATTRPETMLGDAAIAVHPTDRRYQNLIGLHAISPLSGRKISIIGDLHADPEKGSGAVKIGPAHDFNDFALAQRHNLPMYSIFDSKACIILDEIKDELHTIEGVSDIEFVKALEGKDSSTARQFIIEELTKLNLLVKTENHILQIPYADRGGAIVEPRLTTQWFCNAAELAKPAIEAVEKGTVKFVPQSWENSFFAWMNNIEPWCISRQLWWGHRIPAWYGPDGEIFVEDSEEKALTAAKQYYKKDNIALIQDEDVLDTWFSSALWPFATLGWPKNTPDLNRYYPTDVLVTGFDIIFFWVSRMMMMGLHFMKDVPFHTIFIHGLILDEHGQKMSKTKGNVIDPLELMEQYGADTLRWSVCALTGPGRNLKLSPTNIETSRTFMTKIRNAAVFCQRSQFNLTNDFESSKVQNSLSRWLLAKMNETIIEATKALGDFRFDEYTNSLYNFIWSIFCDWFIELSKAGLTSADAEEIRTTGAFVFSNILRLLHPSIPFITEELWSLLGFGTNCSLIKENWPRPVSIFKEEEATDEVNWIIEVINSIRSLRAEMKIQTAIPVFFHEVSEENMKKLINWQKSIQQLAKASEVNKLTKGVPEGSVQIMTNHAVIVVPLADIVDNEAENKRLEKEILKLEAQIEKLNLQLENQDFLNRAPEKVIAERKEQVKFLKNEIERLKKALNFTL